MKFTENTLFKLGFTHDPQAIEHTGIGEELIWTKNTAEIKKLKYKAYQIGLSDQLFMQLIIKVVQNENIIAVYLITGESPQKSFTFRLSYETCKSEREFKRIMKRCKLWKRIKSRKINTSNDLSDITKEF